MAVEVRHVVKRYGGETVLRDVSLRVEDGQFVALLGPSGCGKTTLLNAVAGLIDVDGGEVAVDGQVWSKPGATLPPERRNIGMVFQDYALWPHMSVFANIAFGLRLKGFARKEIRERVDEVLDIVEMRRYRDGSIQSLSGGQKQRIAIARALAASPRLMLMDEPLSSLDAKLRERMRWDLLAIVHRTGMTTIYVTHDQTEALSMADHVLLLHDGRVEQEGPPEALYDAPRTVFTAEFVGASNILECEPGRTAHGGVELKFGGLTLHAGGDVPASGPVPVLLRPHALSLAPGGEAQQADGWDGAIRERAYQGTQWQYRVELTAAKAVLEVWSPRRFRQGDPVTVHCPPDAVRVLNRGLG